jgi:hypothetical protein
MECFSVEIKKSPHTLLLPHRHNKQKRPKAQAIFVNFSVCFLRQACYLIAWMGMHRAVLFLPISPDLKFSTERSIL